MDYGDRLSIRPGEANDAIGQLADFADRIKRVLETEALNLTMVPSARDEVSQRVAATLTEVHTSFAKATDQGQTQMREIATALRTHTDNVAAADEAV